MRAGREGRRGALRGSEGSARVRVRSVVVVRGGARRSAEVWAMEESVKF